MAEKIHDLGKVTIIKEKVVCTHEEVAQWISDNDIINNFIGWVEVIDSFVMENVPSDFPDYQVQETKEVEETYVDEAGEEQTRTIIESVVDDNGNPVMRSKTWEEYVGSLIHKSVNEGKVLIPVGHRDVNGNRLKPVGNAEFRIWVEHFGISNILTKSEGKSLIEVEESEL